MNTVNSLKRMTYSKSEKTMLHIEHLHIHSHCYTIHDIPSYELNVSLFIKYSMYMKYISQSFMKSHLM